MVPLSIAGCSADDHPDSIDPTAIPGETESLPDSADGRLKGSDCPIAVPTNQRAACGVLTVPADYQDASKGTLELPVMVFKGRGSQSPVVYLEGGPGGPALDSMNKSFKYFEPLLADRDLVVFDQRGAGYATPQPDCSTLDEEPELDEGELDDEQALQKALPLVAQCAEILRTNGPDPKVFTTHANANDVEVLRAALGYPTWNLFGVSYGTRLALDVMRYFPAGVASVVLDSVLPPQVDWQAASALNAQHAFDRIFEHCATQPSCRNAYPNLDIELYSMVQRLNDAPEELRLSNGASYTFDGDEALQLIFLAAYDAEAITVIPEIIAQFAEGRFRVAIAVKEAELDGTDGLSGMSLGMYFSVVCSEYAAYESVEAVRAANATAHPLVSRALGNEDIFPICAAWNVPPAPPAEREAVQSNIPTLVLSGAYDPVTPGAWGELVSQTLNRSYFLSFEGASHGVFSESCGPSMLNTFWSNPSLNPASACPGRNQDLVFEVLRGDISTTAAAEPLSLTHDSSLAERVVERLRHRIH